MRLIALSLPDVTTLPQTHVLSVLLCVPPAPIVGLLGQGPCLFNSAFWVPSLSRYSSRNETTFHLEQMKDTLKVWEVSRYSSQNWTWPSDIKLQNSGSQVSSDHCIWPQLLRPVLLSLSLSWLFWGSPAEVPRVCLTWLTCLSFVCSPVPVSRCHGSRSVPLKFLTLRKWAIGWLWARWDFGKLYPEWLAFISWLFSSLGSVCMCICMNVYSHVKNVNLTLLTGKSCVRRVF